jgi:hypothetical protein
MAALIGRNHSRDLRERAMRLSSSMSCQDMGDTLEIIFSADQRNDGRFTLQEYDRLMVIVDAAADAAKAKREASHADRE